MTDHEIIRVLKYCSNGQDCENCHFNKSGNCIDTVMRLALDLIKRQKAESERLEHHCFGIQNELEAYKDTFNTAIDEAKSEAIKEFAERLDRKFAFYYPDTQCISVLAVRKSIQNELKEMTEGKENA